MAAVGRHVAEGMAPVVRLAETGIIFAAGRVLDAKAGAVGHHFDQISTYALQRLARFVAKRHGRASGYGMTVVAYLSTNRLGLINLSGTVVAPRAFKSWRAKPNAGGEGRR
jgi:hypothetical protein